MKTRQLANILIKILGLSTVVHCIPGLLTGIYNMVRLSHRGGPGDVWFYPCSSLLLGAIGVFLICKSREVTAYLFKEDE